MPRTLDEMLTLAEIVVQSGLALGHRTKESVVIALQLGAELGFMPMQSLRTIAVIQGRPVPSADGCVAAVTASGRCDYFREVETTDTHSTWETLRRGDAAPRRFTFTLDDARRAGLTHREHWQAYPKRMLAARAKKYLAQDTYPDVIGGLLSAEEALDLTTAPAPSGKNDEPVAEALLPIRITTEQVAMLQGLIGEGGLDAEECLAWLRGRLPEVHALTDLPAAEYARVKKALEDRNAKRQLPPGETEHATED
ncbi:MAG TPA: hypothetical protein VK688_12215 [Gemmatimonadales bacterium]|nr:hypothetical protein [Gemmatimonadales bacterium]